MIGDFSAVMARICVNGHRRPWRNRSRWPVRSS
jgi:hypothetical protein